MKMTKVSDYIANFFIKHNIDKCFTVTGGGAMHLNDSFGHHPKFECIYNHHEQACSMAADGYARISGKPAVVCVTSGPGTTNTITGVLGSWLDSLPMIVLSGQMQFNTTISSTPLPLRHLGFQEFNIIDSVKCMTKYAEMITDPNYIAYHLEKALYHAQQGRKGPVWLDIPLNVQSAMVDEDSLIHYQFDSDMNSNYVNKEAISKILQKIQESKSPVILAGYEVRMSNSFNEFLNLVSKLQIPVLTEWNSNDLIWNDHPYFAGRPGTIGDRGGNFVLQNADLVLAIGCQFTLRQISYAWTNFAKKAYKIAISTDKYEMIKPTVKIDYPIQSNIKSFLLELTSCSPDNLHGSNTDWYQWCKKINNKYPVVQEKHFAEDLPLSVYGFVGSLSNKLLEGDTVALANGAACVVGLQAINLKLNQRIFTNAGASSMGYGICAAIGAYYATNGQNQIICIEGDGSIQMNLQELQTIIHNNLNIKIFWINNDGYHSIKQTQNSMFDAKKKGFCGANEGSGISFPSAEKIAYAYGFEFFKITKVAELSETLDAVISHSGPLICEVVTNPNELFEPKLQSKLLEDGKFFTPSLEDMYPFLSEQEMEENVFS